MGSTTSWMNFVIRKPSIVKKEESKLHKQRTKPQPASDSDSEYSSRSYSSTEEFILNKDKLP